MMDFSQFIGFLAFLFVFAAGFWLLLFLLTFIVPYWITGTIFENIALKNPNSAIAKKIEKIFF